MKNINIAYILFFVMIMCNSMNAQQQVVLDKLVKAGKLKLFPHVKDNGNYYYLPDKARLASHPNGTPIFSYQRYVKNEKTSSASNEGISESDIGGGILHFMVELNVSDEDIKEAQKELRRIDSKGKIIGPISINSGKVALVSTLTKPNGKFESKVVGLGNAPVMENQGAAVSVHLNKIGSKILWENFNMSTLDLSVRFEMELEGYSSPKEIKIEGRYENIYKNEKFNAAVAMPVIQGEINTALEDLFESNTIKVTQIGDDETLEEMRKAAYDQLLQLLFDRTSSNVAPNLNELNPGNEKSMLDRATEQLKKARQETREENHRIERREDRESSQESNARRNAQTRADRVRVAGGHDPINRENRDDEADEERQSTEKKELPNLSIAVSYTLKKIRKRGEINIDLNKFTATTRNIGFDYNPGNVKKDCPSCFAEVNLDDPMMEQREITATLGGVSDNDFKHVNFVNVLLRKEHQNGQETVDELKIDKSAFNLTGNFFKMLYGWKSDGDRDKWLSYDFKTMWSINGDYTVESDWKTTKFGSISLEPPVIKKPVYIEVDPDFIATESIRAIEVKVFSKLGKKQQIEVANLNTSKDEFSRNLGVLLPRDVEEYEYEVVYFVKGKDPVKSEKKISDYGRIDIDRFL